MGHGPGRGPNAANGTGSDMHRGTYRRLLLAVCVGGAAPACDGQTDCVALNGRYLTGTVRMDLPEDTSKVCSLTDPQPEHRWPTSEGLFPPPVEFWLRPVDGGVEMIEEGGGHWSATLSHRGGGEQDGTPPPGLPFFDPQARFGVASYGVNKFGFPLPALGEGCAGNIQYFVSLESGILDEDCAAEIRVYHFQTVGRGLCQFSAWCEDRFVAHAKKVQNW